VKDSRIDVLRRIAFGRESTAEERADATEELRKLEIAQATEARQTAVRQAAIERDVPLDLANEPDVTEHGDSVPREISPASDPHTPATEAEAPGPRRRTAVRAIWLVPIILASLAVGAIGGSVWGAAHQSTASPSAHASFALGTDGSGQPGGDLAAAEHTLAQPQTTQDVYPLPALVQNLRQSSVRRLGGPDETVQTWVGRNTEDELCLLVYESKTHSGAASCATTADFTSHAITLGFNQYQVSWDGTKATVFMPYGS
jgi:hypothetical protein